MWIPVRQIFLFLCTSILIITLYIAARTTYRAYTNYQPLIDRRYSIKRVPAHPPAASFKSVDSDQTLNDLEKYIFGARSGTVKVPKRKKIARKWDHYAKLIKKQDIKLIPKIEIDNIDCRKVIRNETKYINHVIKFMDSNPRMGSNSRLKDCKTIRKGYISSPMTEDERKFPLAYSLTVYKDWDLVEKILKSIYRPHNYYCLHVDAKAEKKFYKKTVEMAKCFDNVFIASRRLDVQWGKLQILLADLLCMRDLLKYKWKYYINLTGQEFPLRNNFELVHILRSLGGCNDIESTSRHKYNIRYSQVHDIDGQPTTERMPEVPLNITVVKGNMHGALARGFVDFLLNDGRSRTFYNWVKYSGKPEETFFPTMNSNSHIGAPGSLVGTTERLRLMSREIRWYTNCGGKLVRGVCVNGLADLKRLADSKKLFVNKFHLDFQYLALDCFEQWFYNRSAMMYSRKLAVDLRPYKRWIKDPCLGKN